MVRAQDAAAPAPAAPSALVPATRRDLAEAYVAFEHAFFSKVRTPEQERAANLQFDSITQLFFTGQFSEANVRLREASVKLWDDDEAASDYIQSTLAFRCEPEILVGPIGECQLALVSRCFAPLRFPVMIDQPTFVSEESTSRSWLCPEGVEFEPIPAIRVPAAEPCVFRHPFDAGISQSPRAFSAQLWWTDGCIGGALAYTTPEPFSRIRDGLLARLSAVEGKHANLGTALAIARARCALLTDQISETDAASFSQNLAELAAELNSEVAALEQGANPFRFNAESMQFLRGAINGGVWRPIILPAGVVPCCVVPRVGWETPAPERLPLVIAFHGAGGDEFMFMDGYGSGRLPRLAAERQFILACPQTFPFLLNPDAFDKLIEQLSADYPIDPDRIYIIGHSMGGVAVANLLRTRSDKIAAAVGFAPGGAFVDATGKPLAHIAPTRWISAELDPIIPAARVRKVAKAAQDAGLPVESITIPNYGHTLVVGKALPDAVDWLLTHKREPVPAR